MIDVREVLLDNGEIEYLLFLRNPAGNFYQREDEVWMGDWSPKSDKWTTKTRKQCNYYLTLEEIKDAFARGKAELREFMKKPKEKKEKKAKKLDADGNPVKKKRKRSKSPSPKRKKSPRKKSPGKKKPKEPAAGEEGEAENEEEPLVKKKSKKAKGTIDHNDVELQEEGGSLDISKAQASAEESYEDSIDASEALEYVSSESSSDKEYANEDDYYAAYGITPENEEWQLNS